MIDFPPSLLSLIALPGPALLILCLATLVSYGLTKLVHKVLLAKMVLDVPNERSMHTTPVPRGGGLAIVSVILAGLGVAFAVGAYLVNGDQVFTQNYINLYAPLIGAALLLVGVSWWDDKRGVPPVIRLAVHLVAAALGCLALPTDAMVFGGVMPLWLDRAIVVIGWAWFMNLYNFMDGIDGLTISETICIAAGLCLLAVTIELDMPDDTHIYLIRNGLVSILVIGACFGFAKFNWHPAKIFMGDVGSVPLGFFVGFLLLHMAVDGFPVAAIILPLYYLADSGITITSRALRREKIWQAHREHFYQKAALSVDRHDTVVKWVVKTNLALIVLAFLSLSDPWPSLVLAIMAVSFLLSLMHKATIKS